LTALRRKQPYPGLLLKFDDFNALILVSEEAVARIFRSDYLM